MDELFQFLFIKQCNALNANLPELFEKTNDYTELLLAVSYNDIEGVIYKLVHDVSEADFDVNSKDGHGQIEIIGWLYQYYNTEPKATVFGRPKSKKIEKQDIPAATQLFTPEWIVKYMVENSLGRLWIEKLLSNGDTRSEEQIAKDFKWKYYIPEAEKKEVTEIQLKEQLKGKKTLSVEEITFLDPAMGSFHIGIYAFEVFLQLYESEGYMIREATKLILERNLYGLDIDKRATQLGYFACMMQARKYNRRILESDIRPNVYEIVESNYINRDHLNYLGTNIKDNNEWSDINKQLLYLLDSFEDAKEYGSLININDELNFSQLKEFVKSHEVDTQILLLETMGLEETQRILMNLIEIAEIISKKYKIVITNPPYMGSGGMNKKLSNYSKKYYPDSKSDMFAMFIEKCKEFTAKDGFFAMITQHAWMFLSSYENLRLRLLSCTLINLIHLGTKAFEEVGGEVVQTAAFIYRNSYNDFYLGKYVKLTDFKNQMQKKIKYLEIIKNSNPQYLYQKSQEKFKKIAGSPIAYWLSDKGLLNFNIGESLGSLSKPKVGLQTGNNEKYFREWYEVEFNKINHKNSRNPEEKWNFCSKGGQFRRWFGNIQTVIDWQDDGYRVKLEKGAVIRNPDYYYRAGIEWTKITSGNLSARQMPDGMILTDGSVYIFPAEQTVILGFLNSKVAQMYLSVLNPTLNYVASTVANLPIIEMSPSARNEVESLVQENIMISREDFNLSETSADFKRPLLLSVTKKNSKCLLLCDAYKEISHLINDRFKKLWRNEEKINDIFINLYGLQEEMTCNISPDQVSVSYCEDNNYKFNSSFIENENSIIKELISYIVGCSLGRYSSEGGLAFAGGEYHPSKYVSYLPVEDNILPITEQEYFSNDIVNNVEEFIRIWFGNEVLEENLHFIATVLGNDGTSSREIIRNYFIRDFYKDHIQMYQKKPIYWLYDSGKQNGFKALVYMHRYDENISGKVRVDYLHQIQKVYERNILSLEEETAYTTNAKEATHIQKRIEKLTKQLKECKEYDEHLGHMALERISIDLDDGVKVNYQKVQTDSKGKVHQILAKIK